jgi:hypothetical protein
MTRMYDEMRICLEGWHYIVWRGRAKTSFCRLRRDTAIAADCTSTTAAAALPTARLQKPGKKFWRDQAGKYPGLRKKWQLLYL